MNRQQKIQEIEILEALKTVRHENLGKKVYESFYDWQRRFNKATAEFTACMLMAANQVGKCVTEKTLIPTPDGDFTVKELYDRGDGFKVYSWDGSKPVVADACAPFKKEGLHHCYRIALEDGSYVEVADRHRISTKSGYLYVDDLLQSFSCHQPTNKECDRLVRASGVERLFEKLPDCLADYFRDYHHDDVRLQTAVADGLVFLPSLADVQQHSAALCSLDDQGYDRHAVVLVFNLIHPVSVKQR